MASKFITKIKQSLGSEQPQQKPQLTDENKSPEKKYKSTHGLVSI